VVECPYCGYKGDFKLLKTWKYKWWDVYFYECPHCLGKFRWQIDPEGKKKNYIIKVRKGR
jgi:uncharacterized Zn finger protein